jgi:hypothetical protein
MHPLTIQKILYTKQELKDAIDKIKKLKLHLQN